MDVCPKCLSNEKVVIERKSGSCLCDRDFCFGDRCGANEMIATYKCTECDNYIFTSLEYTNYIKYHCN